MKVPDRVKVKLSKWVSTRMSSGGVRHQMHILNSMRRVAVVPINHLGNHGQAVRIRNPHN